MEHTYRKRAEAFLKRHGKKRIWHGALTAMAAVVVFITSYMLILPAITLSQEPVCGLEAHTHTAQCNPLYDEETGGWIYSCGLEAHVHTDACYPQAEPEPVYYCGLDEHVHGADCYKLDTLICMQTEHIHGAECLQPRTAETVETDSSADAPDGQGGEVPGSGEPSPAEQRSSAYIFTTGKKEEEDVTSGDALEEETDLYDSDVTSGDAQQSTTGGGNRVSSEYVSGGDVSQGNWLWGNVSSGDVTSGDVSSGEVPQGDVNSGDTYPQVHERRSRLQTLASDEGGDEGPGVVNTREGGIQRAETPKKLLTGELSEGGNKLKATGSGTVYHPDTNSYTSDLKFTFSLTKEQAIEAGLEFYIDVPDGVIVPSDLLDVTRTGYDDAGQPGFTYEYKKVGDRYQILIHMDEAYVQGAGDQMHAHIEFKGELGSSGYQSGGGLSYDFSDEVKLTIEGKDISYPDNENEEDSLEATKEGSYVTADNKLHYTVRVKSQKGTTGKVSISDTLDAGGLQVVGGPEITGFKAYKLDQWGNQVGSLEGVTYEDFTASEDHLSWNATLPAMPEFSEYVLEYEYDLAEIGDSDVFTAHNSVKTTSRNTTTGRDVVSGKTADVQVKKAKMSKTGAYNSATNKVTWTIVINEDKLDIAGAELTDEMFGQFTKEELSLSLNPDKGYEVLTDADGKVTGIRFVTDPDNSEGKNTNKYTIQYESDAGELEWGKNTWTNKATFQNGGGSQESTGTVTYDYGGGLQKSHKEDVTEQDGKITIDWNFSFQVPAAGLSAASGETEAIEIRDELQNYNRSEWRMDHYFTWQQIREIAESLQKTDWFLAGSDLDHLYVKYYVRNPANDWEWLPKWAPYNEMTSQRDLPTALDDLPFEGFKVEMYKGLDKENWKDKKLELSYTSTADVSGVAMDADYTNIVYVQDKGVSDSYKYKKGVVKTNRNSQINSSTENFQSVEETELIWKVRVVPDCDLDQLTITDIMPAGVTVKSITYKAEGYDEKEFPIDGNNITVPEGTGLPGGMWTGTLETDQSGDPAVTRQKVKLNLTRDLSQTVPDWMKKGKEIWITYHCQVGELEDLELKPGETWSQDYTNHVDVQIGERPYGSGDQEQHVNVTVPKEEPKVLDKSGIWNNEDSLANYSVIINKGGADLLPGEGNDVLTLTDVLEYNANDYGGAVQRTAELLLGSVTLYEITYDDEGNEIKSKVSDSDWSWTYDIEVAEGSEQKTSHTITAKVPDRKELCLEYSYRVTCVMPSDWANTFVGVSNTAKLTGATETSKEDLASEKWQDSGSSAGIRTDGYTFYKVDKDNYGILIEGAKFGLYKVTPEGEEEQVHTYVTNSNGMISLNKKKENEESDEDSYDFQDNTLYYLTETAAVEGYELPDPVPKYYFYFSESSDGSWWTGSPGLTALNAVNLSKQARKEYVENSKIPKTDITVEKLWQEENPGAEAGGEPQYFDKNTGNVEVALYRRTVKEDEGGTEAGTQNPRLRVTTNYPTGDGRIPGLSYSNERTYDMHYYSEGTEVTIILKYSEWFDADISEEGQNSLLVEGTDKVSNYQCILTKMQHEDASSENNTIGTYTITFDMGEENVDLTVTLPGNNWLRWYYEIKSKEPVAPSPQPSGEGSSIPDELVDTYTLSPSNGWKFYIKDLPVKGFVGEGTAQKKVRYEYYVKEVKVDGVDVSGPEAQGKIVYTNNEGITTGIITIINKGTQQTYELPNTGGAGTRLYTLGGLFATALAGLLLYRKSRGKEERFSS